MGGEGLSKVLGSIPLPVIPPNLDPRMEKYVRDLHEYLRRQQGALTPEIVETVVIEQSTKVIVIEGDITVLEGDVATLEGKVTTLEGRIGTLNLQRTSYTFTATDETNQSATVTPSTKPTKAKLVAVWLTWHPDSGNVYSSSEFYAEDFQVEYDGTDYTIRPKRDGSMVEDDVIELLMVYLD